MISISLLFSKLNPTPKLVAMSRSDDPDAVICPVDGSYVLIYIYIFRKSAPSSYGNKEQKGEKKKEKNDTDTPPDCANAV
jgi:hypothetical protein